MSSNSDLEKLRRQLREAAPDAIAALHAICRDDRAPAPARATAAGWVLRASGLADKADAPADDSETMSPAELEETIARLKAHAAALDERAARAKEARAQKSESTARAKQPKAQGEGRGKDAGGLFD